MYITEYFFIYSYFIALITNLPTVSFFYFNNTLFSVCSESPMEAAWNRGGEGAIICGSMIRY